MAKRQRRRLGAFTISIRPPWNRLLGAVHARGPVSGTIILDRKTVTSWGEPERPDLTFSVAKTYLALLAGVAFDQDCFIDKLEKEKAFAIYEVSVDFPSDYQRLLDANFNDPAGSTSLATKCQRTKKSDGTRSVNTTLGDILCKCNESSKLANLLVGQERCD